MGLLHHGLQHPSQEKPSPVNLPEIKAGGPVKGLNLRVDVRHTNENDRHFYLRFDTTLAGERSYFRDHGQVFCYGAHRRSFADRPGGPLVHQHLLAGLCCIFTSTCLLDFAASSPAFAYWTFLRLKVRNRTVYFNCSRFLGLFSSIIPFPMQ